MLRRCLYYCCWSCGFVHFIFLIHPDTIAEVYCLDWLGFAGNHISDIWFKSDSYIKCKLMDQLPTIQTTLDSIHQLLEDPEMAAKY